MPRDESGRLPTMKDVAAAAGVSKALVSMVFRDVPGAGPATRAHVLAVAEQIGYRPNRTASSLARRRSKHLGVTLMLRNPFHAELVEDAQAAADAVGYELVLSTVTRTHDEQRAIETLLEYRCEALLLIGPDSSAQQLAVLAARLPVVVIGRRISVPGVDVVRTAEDAGMRAVVDHLVSLGHRRIVHLGAGSSDIATDRRHGYEAAMRAHGLHADIRTIESAPTEEGGGQAAQEVCARGWRPTAVAAFNDRSAIGLIDGLRRAGVVVPQEISVVGFDDIPVSRVVGVNLTTVSQEARAQADWAVRAAVQRLDDGRTADDESVVVPRLVVRGTTGPPPAAGAPHRAPEPRPRS